MLRHVAGDAEVDDCQVSHFVSVGVKPANNGEASPVVDVLADLVQSATEIGQRKGVGLDGLAIKAQLYEIILSDPMSLTMESVA